MFNKRAHYMDICYRIWIRSVCSLIAHLKAYWWGVPLGKHFKVKGKIFFNRKYNSFITFGNHTHCNSKNNSNLIGVNRPCMFSTLLPGASIQVGDSCGFSGTVIGAFDSIILGNNVRCGANTLITDSDWHLDDLRSGKPSPIKIHDNVWLGEGVKVLKGVEIGENTVIGAGSVVVKSIPANVVAAGNPCKVIKVLNNA